MDVLLTAEVPKKKDWTCARDVILTHSPRLFPLRIQQARIARISGAVRPQILSSLLLKLSTMLYFIETGNYECNPHAYTAFPLLTPLDYHIHAYLVSSKYGVVALQERALIAYIDNAAQEMKLGFMMLQSGQASDAQKVAPGYSAIPLTGGRVGGELLTMPIDRFLNSLVLLWKNTPSRYDPLRKAVLKLIKRDLNKFLRVPFFVTLMQEMVGFGDDVVASLGDDGFEVKAFQVSIGGRSQAIRFGV